MKTTLLALAAAALSGCAVYPSPAYETYESPVLVPYGVVQQPTYIYGSVYSSHSHRAYPRGYRQPHVAPQPVHPQVHAPHPGHGMRGNIHDRLHRGPPHPRWPHHRR